MNYVTQIQPLPTFSASHEAVLKFTDEARENSGRTHFLRLNWARDHICKVCSRRSRVIFIYRRSTSTFFREYDTSLNLNYLDQGQPLPEVSFFKYVAFEEHFNRELAAGKGST